MKIIFKTNASVTRAQKIKITALSLGICTFLISLAQFTGCGLLFGGSSKVDRKDHGYHVMRLDQVFPDRWNLLPKGTLGASTGSKQNSFNEEVDLAFDNKAGVAFVSLNSVCNEAEQEAEPDLEPLLTSLVMGTIGAETVLDKKSITVDGRPALQATYLSSPRPDRKTIARNSANKSSAPSQTKIRAVVTTHRGCTFDFLYLAAPQKFEENLADFEKFIGEFHAQ